ncbi:zinc ABC transporter permease subunit ZnuB [Marinobacter lutaoensis]|jgi:zinc transport system permease protein|uniref:High-affinity zinc uptake system membrane protein ZnuB n=1 Tax=Marinobacter lutaoensis TaxID=135739 RepID=A0A1V2DNL8_9GAMM|nr:zinc ABC transporter permease subunit ZnuB [Marinobacter lutaoensis]MBE02310.1 zinc ABC transporter permease [Marinobacter sp.]MBI43782.1 zinc ABC transporter permease [Oceanospirillales bacterium]NVD35696.1 zinc ABC transporter permease subunit ZnuB [Marinobacter lutaoensis]ONF42232.1 zinc ABC transporter permease [Marinobacter lutaoensis]|tara:strand:- start:7212 stop:8024 length:813 start_codon:yes stop_codon:yes gene_type:complete
MSLIDSLLNDFFWRALLGGVGVALVAGPLGCFVVWRRLAYFGDTLAHSALLGIALSFLISLPLNLAVILTCVCIALLLVLLSRTRTLATDTLLGILAHSALAIGLVTLSFMPEVRLDLTGLLFGDLLAMSRDDLLWIYGGAVLVLALLVRLWRGLLMSTIHEELARVEGVPVERLRLILMVMFSLVIAVAMKIVGVLLITALLIIPAATARRLARTPEHMVGLAMIFGCLAVAGGLALSWYLDTPAGPSVVVTAFATFLLTYAATVKATA